MSIETKTNGSVAEPKTAAAPKAAAAPKTAPALKPAPAAAEASKPKAKADAAKAAKPTAPAPKAAPAPAKESKPKAKATGAKSADRRRPFADEAVIHVLKTAHECRGFRGAALDTIKDGMTVEKFKAALAKKEAAGATRLSTYTGWALTTALELKLISIK